MINPANFESEIEEQIRELLGIVEEETPNEKPANRSREEIEDKFDDLSDEEKLVSDVSDDEDLFESKPNEAQLNNAVRAIKTEGEFEGFQRNLDSFLNDKRTMDPVDRPAIKTEKYEKYESSISSTEEFDDMD